jgi:iron(III) transport system substrate-binding protein
MVSVKRLIRPVCFTALVLGLVASMGCKSAKEGSKSDEGIERADKAGSLMVYSGRSKTIMEPLFEKFQDKTGIEIKAVYDKKTWALAERIAKEGKNTEADIFLGQDPGYIGALANAGHLAELPQAILDLVSENHRGPKGHWVGTSGRARVLVYNPEKVKAAELPETLEDLAAPKWKGRVGWAPSNASFQAHISTLRKVWGEKKTAAWLNRMSALDIRVYPKNSPQVKGVANGEIEIGWVNHYYLHRAQRTNPNIKARNYSFQSGSDVGNLMMLSGVGITKHSQRKAAATKLVEFLLGTDAQNHFAQKVFEYPTVSGIKLHADVPPIPDGALAGDKAALADVQGTIKLLRRLKLL